MKRHCRQRPEFLSKHCTPTWSQRRYIEFQTTQRSRSALAVAFKNAGNLVVRWSQKGFKVWPSNGVKFGRHWADVWQRLAKLWPRLHRLWPRRRLFGKDCIAFSRDFYCVNPTSLVVFTFSAKHYSGFTSLKPAIALTLRQKGAIQRLTGVNI